MVNIYIIKNRDKGVTVELNEIMLLETLKVLKYRNKELYILWIKKVEELEQRVYNEEVLNF